MRSGYCVHVSPRRPLSLSSSCSSRPCRPWCLPASRASSLDGALLAARLLLVRRLDVNLAIVLLALLALLPVVGLLLVRVEAVNEEEGVEEVEVEVEDGEKTKT